MWEVEYGSGSRALALSLPTPSLSPPSPLPPLGHYGLQYYCCKLISTLNTVLACIILSNYYCHTSPFSILPALHVLPPPPLPFYIYISYY